MGRRPGQDGRMRIRRQRIGSWLVYYYVAVLWTAIAAASSGVQALVQQTQVIARCLGWANNSCVFSPLEPVHFAGLKLTEQTVCKVRH